MRACITGASGFVGAHLSRLLTDQPGWTVAAVSRGPAAANLPLVVTQHRLDLLEQAATTALLAILRPDVIVHLAGQSSVSRSLREPALTLTSNLLPLLHLLEGCRATGLDPLIVVAGSAEEYGETARAQAPLTEEHPLRPVSPYAVSKVAQETLAEQYHRTYGLRVVRLRLFNHIGPGQRAEFALPSFARQIARIEAGRQPPVLRVGNLNARRDFLDVRDAARAYLAAIERGQPGAVYNVGSGQAESVQAMLDRLIARSDAPITIETDPALVRPVDIPLLLADASRFRVATGWRPAISIEQTAADILDDWRRRVAAGEG